MRFALVGAALAALVALPASAADWSVTNLVGGALHGQSGQISTWTEAGTTDSGALHCLAPVCHCVNTHATNAFTPLVADSSGTTHGSYMGSIPASGTCGTATAESPCAKFQLVQGRYVFSPDATGASAECEVK